MSKISKIEQYVIDKVRELRLKADVSQVSLSLDIGLSSKFVGMLKATKIQTSTILITSTKLQLS
jgi:hypothetical protein